MRNRGTATRYPGVYSVDDDTYWVRAKTKDLRTGKLKIVGSNPRPSVECCSVHFGSRVSILAIEAFVPSRGDGSF